MGNAPGAGVPEPGAREGVRYGEFPHKVGREGVSGPLSRKAYRNRESSWYVEPSAE